MILDEVLRTPDQWLACLDDRRFVTQLQQTCGYDEDFWPERAALLRSALEGFLERFGRNAVFIVRCPGRVNLRGMHIDTHGGYLNVMTHQREIVVVAAIAKNGICTCANADEAFPEFSFAPRQQPDPRDTPWEEFISSKGVTAYNASHVGSWELYVRGCAQSLRARMCEQVAGVHAFVASDLPRGAALSASHALCVAMLMAFERASGAKLSLQERVLAARDAEWYAGARTGTSDQSAMILGHKNTMLAGPLPPSDLDLSRLHTIAWPDDLSLLVAQSFTSRSLSGSDRLAYTANRFAYSLALDILRDALGDEAASLNHLFQITEDRFGKERILKALLAIPERLGMEALRRRCKAEVFDEAYARYFGTLDEAERPSEVLLRGPLMYGIAESERARLFGACIRERKYASAGAWMSIGHAGDRRVFRGGLSAASPTDDAALKTWLNSPEPLASIPGAYGASSAALDWIVDTALDAGAYGASLTGAGIAGVVLALCSKDSAEAVAQHVRDSLQTDEYARVAGLESPLRRSQVQQGVVINRAPGGACVIE